MTLTLSFDFSASHARGEAVVGYNYRLDVTFFGAPDERNLTKLINEALIKKIHSRDLGSNVDLLKGSACDGPSLLKIFWQVITRATAPAQLRSLSLQRDRNTRWALEKSD